MHSDPNQTHGGYRRGGGGDGGYRGGGGGDGGYRGDGGDGGYRGGRGGGYRGDGGGGGYRGGGGGDGGYRGDGGDGGYRGDGGRGGYRGGGGGDGGYRGDGGDGGYRGDGGDGGYRGGRGGGYRGDGGGGGYRGGGGGDGGYRGDGGDGGYRGGRGGDGGYRGDGGGGGYRGGRGGDGGYRGDGGGGGYRGGRGGDGGYRGGRGGGGGYRGGRGGGGGYRGGRGGGGGYRGGGGCGFNTRECREREENGITVAKENAASLCAAQVIVQTNCFPIDVSPGKFHNYVTSYEFLENGKDMAGDSWKIDFQQELLRAIRKTHTTERCSATSTEVEDMCVCTGQAILAPCNLSVEDGFSIECKRKEKEGRKTIVERHYRVTIRYEGLVRLRLPEHAQWVNSILACGLRDTYPEHVGSDYIDLKSRVERGDDLVTMDAITLSATRVVRLAPGGQSKMQDVLQLDVATKASTTKKCSDVIRHLSQRSPQSVKRAVNEVLVGAKVTTMFGEPTFLKVKSVDFDVQAGYPAKLKGDPKETFVQYFKRKYGATIHPESPIMYCRYADRAKNGRLLPYPADTLQLSTLSTEQLSKLPMLCSIYPEERMKRVNAALTRITASKLMKTVLEQYGIRIETQAITAVGRVQPAPTIYVPTGQSRHNSIAAVEYTGQAGFALGLKGLHHPDEPSKYKTVFMDNYFNRGNIARWLKEYNVALPTPTVECIAEPKKFHKGAPGIFAMVRLPNKDAQRYNDFKQRFAQDSVVSQMVVTDLNRNVPQMVTQQVAAKIGQLCFVTDVSAAGKVFADRPVLVVSAVVGSAMDMLAEKYKTVNAKLYTVVFVAFLASNKIWKPYCMHYQVKGEEQVLYDERDTASSSMSTDSPAGRKENANEVLNNKFPDFLKEVVAHFKLNGKSGKGAMVLYRGAMTDAETAFVENMESAVEQVLPSWDTATVVVQPHSHFRMCWDPVSTFPNEMDRSRGGYCNVPRGFVTNDCRIMFAGADPSTPVESFYLSGANCSLGHASNTYYLVQKRSLAISMVELQQLTYNMCYMYPNKPDALPLPLPIKCAFEYARKFGSLKGVKELPQWMRPTMHYL